MARARKSKSTSVVIAALAMGLLLASCGYKPKVGHTVRVKCLEPDSAGIWIQDESIALVDRVTPLGDVIGEIPCGTVVTITEILTLRAGWGTVYFVVPLDTELPRGWICQFITEHIRLIYDF